MLRECANVRICEYANESPGAFGRNVNMRMCEYGDMRMGAHAKTLRLKAAERFCLLIIFSLRLIFFAALRELWFLALHKVINAGSLFPPSLTLRLFNWWTRR